MSLLRCNLLNIFCVKLCCSFTSALLMAPPGFHKVSCGGDRNHLWWIMQLFESESVRLVLPCRDREASNISSGVMFDWGLLAPPVLFLFVNRLSGNVVIIVAEASICSICMGGGREGGAALVSNPFSQVLMGDRGVEGVE